jgi:hypothetical protein
VVMALSKGFSNGVVLQSLRNGLALVEDEMSELSQNRRQLVARCRDWPVCAARGFLSAQDFLVQMFPV